MSSAAQGTEGDRLGEEWPSTNILELDSLCQGPISLNYLGRIFCLLLNLPFSCCSLPSAGITNVWPHQAKTEFLHVVCQSP